MRKSKRSNGVHRTLSEKLKFVNDVDKLRSMGKKVREAVKIAKGSYRTYYAYKKEIKNGTLEDGRLSPITDKHVEFIGAFVCAWPHASLDSYMTALKHLFPNDLNRTKLYNFLLLNGLSNRNERKRKVSLFMKREEDSISNYYSYYAFRGTDASLRSQFNNDWDKDMLKKERNGFWVKHFTPATKKLESQPKLDYRNLFKRIK